MQVIEHSEAGLTFEGLIDALLVLYEECGHDKIKSKNEVVASFLAKFQSMVHNYNKLRVNINDFQVKRVIGRGKFGEVKLVKEKSSGAVYALKVMKKTGESSSAFFSDERDIMARNSSPWLTKLDYAFQDGTYLYLAMEFHCGGDLLGLMERMDNHLDEDHVRFYIAEVALGIHDLHKMGFVHRDIKPENILIDRTGHVKLADFGNAARLSSSGAVSKAMPVGTPEYIVSFYLVFLNFSKINLRHQRSCSAFRVDTARTTATAQSATTGASESSPLRCSTATLPSRIYPGPSSTPTPISWITRTRRSPFPASGHRLKSSVTSSLVSSSQPGGD